MKQCENIDLLPAPDCHLIAFKAFTYQLLSVGEENDLRCYYKRGNRAYFRNKDQRVFIVFRNSEQTSKCKIGMYLKIG